MSNETLREALKQIKYKAVSLADAQVIALEALSQPMPEAAAFPNALRVALEDLDSMESLGPTTEAVIDAAQKWYLSASPAAPQQQDQDIEQLIQERDHRDEIIDRLCDAVLGADRPEWSSAYGFDDAVADVEDRITQLHQPSVDRAWARFEQASAQPQAQGEPLQRWGKAPDGSKYLLVQMPDGYWTPWHIASQALAAKDAALDVALEALEFYAVGDHFTMHDPDAWDTVSGEPQNFYEDENNTATVEDGSIAKAAITKIKEAMK